MTENEAIKELKEDFNELGKAIPCDTGWGIAINEAYSMAIQALEEIQWYRAYREIFESHFSKEALELLSDKEEFGKWLERGKWIAKRCDELNRELEQYSAIGTIEEFKDLKEKSVAKKIIAKKKTKSYLGTDYYCPTCNKRQLTAYMLSKGDDYCKDCGQKIDWSE